MKKAVLFLTGFFTGIPVLRACPFCADVVARSKDAMQAVRFGEGISWSLVVMLGMPFLLVTGITLFLMKQNLFKSETK